MGCNAAGGGAGEWRPADHWTGPARPPGDWNGPQERARGIDQIENLGAIAEAIQRAIGAWGREANAGETVADVAGSPKREPELPPWAVELAAAERELQRAYQQEEQGAPRAKAARERIADALARRDAWEHAIMTAARAAASTD
jgi:hypothetical protein